jgi:hypothetical protein
MITIPQTRHDRCWSCHRLCAAQQSVPDRALTTIIDGVFAWHHHLLVPAFGYKLTYLGQVLVLVRPPVLLCLAPLAGFDGETRRMSRLMILRFADLFIIMLSAWC